jgi:hypothetical protein
MLLTTTATLVRDLHTFDALQTLMGLAKDASILWRERGKAIETRIFFTEQTLVMEKGNVRISKFNGSSILKEIGSILSM